MRRRLIDPAIADLQAEVAAARRAGRWRTARALTAGYLGLAKVLVIAVAGEAWRDVTTWERDEVAGAHRAALIAVLVTTVSTVLLMLPSLAQENAMDRRLAPYLVPSTLPLTVPLGFAIATAWVLHGAARTRRVAGIVLFAAAVTSAGMFANLLWLTPDANQAFREAVMARFDPPVPAPRRGNNELRLQELRERLREARATGNLDDARRLETTYYRKWTISATPVAIVGLIVAFSFNRQLTRRRLTALACGVYAANYTLWMSTDSVALLGIGRPIVLEWIGPALCAAVAVLLTCWRWPARRPA